MVLYLENQKNLLHQNTEVKTFNGNPQEDV